MVWGRGCSESIRAVFGRFPKKFLVDSRQVMLVRFVEVMCRFSLFFLGLRKGGLEAPRPDIQTDTPSLSLVWVLTGWLEEARGRNSQSA